MNRAISSSGGLLNDLREFMEMIKVAHTLFAMPFAIGAVFLALRQFPASSTTLALLLVKVVVAVALARTAAMSFNRWADRRIDVLNPRTSDRSIPAGRISAAAVLGWTIASAAGFVLVASSINTLALQLSPVVLVIILGYSWTKRFTSLCHLVLGLGLGLAPVGAWVAISGTLTGSGGSILWEPWILGTVVMTWTAGFDILYACQDVDFDRRQQLHSIPARLGIATALQISRALHLLMVVALVTLWKIAVLGVPLLVAIILVSALLVMEHRLVRVDDLSRIQRAFFTLNAIISVIIMVALMMEGWPA